MGKGVLIHVLVLVGVGGCRVPTKAKGSVFPAPTSAHSERKEKKRKEKKRKERKKDRNGQLKKKEKYKSELKVPQLSRLQKEN